MRVILYFLLISLSISVNAGVLSSSVKLVYKVGKTAVKTIKAHGSKVANGASISHTIYLQLDKMKEEGKDTAQLKICETPEGLTAFESYYEFCPDGTKPEIVTVDLSKI